MRHCERRWSHLRFKYCRFWVGIEGSGDLFPLFGIFDLFTHSWTLSGLKVAQAHFRPKGHRGLLDEEIMRNQHFLAFPPLIPRPDTNSKAAQTAQYLLIASCQRRRVRLRLPLSVRILLSLRAGTRGFHSPCGFAILVSA